MKIVGGKLEIDLQQLALSLTKDQQRELAKSLAFEDTLIRAVVESLAEGHAFTDDPDGWWWQSPRTMTELRTKLLPLMDEVARETVRGLMDDVRKARQSEEETSDWAWKMYHAWPDGDWRRRPELLRGKATPTPTDAEVDAALAAAEGEG